MPESRRLESQTASDPADRDGRAEALLVEGLDRYFSGHYEEAIHVWTRVLFLDRSHARARAYIDRARTALAERHRKAEEMLHATSELLAQGRTDQARDLLTRAVAATGDDEHAAVLRSRLERIERARGGSSESEPAAVVDAVPIRRWGAWSATRVVAAGVIAVGAVVATVAVSSTMRNWLGLGAAAPPLPPVGRSEPLPILSSSETALLRAQTLYARGRLAEALLVLDRVDPDSATRASADRLRVEIQRILLATRRSGAPAETDRGRQ